MWKRTFFKVFLGGSVLVDVYPPPLSPLGESGWAVTADLFADFCKQILVAGFPFWPILSFQCDIVACSVGETMCTVFLWEPVQVGFCKAPPPSMAFTKKTYSHKLFEPFNQLTSQIYLYHLRNGNTSRLSWFMSLVEGKRKIESLLGAD